MQNKYLRFGRSYHLTSDGRKAEQKRGTRYERTSLKSRREERIGTQKSDERKEQKRNGKVCRSAFALSHRTWAAGGGTGHQLAVVAYRSDQLY